jgi:ABC-type multidrug transport system permease subunit
MLNVSSLLIFFVLILALLFANVALMKGLSMIEVMYVLTPTFYFLDKMISIHV